MDTAYRYGVLYTGFLEKFKDCTYKPYSVGDYLSKESVQRVEELSSSGMANRLKIPLLSGIFDADINIYAVRRNNSSICPKQLTSYMIPFDSSYIFVRDDPDKIKCIGKYFVYHEVGHTLYTSARHQIRMLYDNKTVILFLIWLLLLFQYKLELMFVIVALFLSSISLSKEYKRREEQAKLEDEIWADNFAISALSKKEREKILSFFKKYPFPSNSNLTSSQNTQRAECLNANLAVSLDSQDADSLNKEYDEIFEYKNVSDTYAPLETCTIAALVIAISISVQEPVINAILRSSFLITIPVVLFTVVLAVFCSLTKHEIERFIGMRLE